MEILVVHFYNATSQERPFQQQTTATLKAVGDGSCHNMDRRQWRVRRPNQNLPRNPREKPFHTQK